MTLPYSLLDLSPITEGSDATQALRNTLDLAQHAEGWGYTRYWLAEHHNMTGIASAATSVVIGYVAGGTKTIRVGAGGIMLPNHSPLVIAEQFGTLESLYPGRIDLGLGRAPGSDRRTMHALRRNETSSDTFPQDVMELQHYFEPLHEGRVVQAVPGTGLNVPLWILGSSLFGAQLAAHLGLPFVFASHFSPEQLEDAVHIYRTHFRSSEQLEKPYLMAAVNVFAADTEEDAAFSFTSLQQQFLRLRRGTPGQLPPPADMEAIWSPAEKAMVGQALRYSMVGTRETVKQKLVAFIDRIQPNEIMLTGMMYDHAARLRSFEIAAEIMKELNL